MNAISLKARREFEFYIEIEIEKEEPDERLGSYSASCSMLFPGYGGMQSSQLQVQCK